MRGGKAFVSPLPFALGSNGAMVKGGIVSADLTAAAGIGMKWYRNDVPWNINQGGSTPIEGLPGVYSSTNIAQVVTVVNAVKAAGLKNLLVVTVNQDPGLCPTTGAALSSGTTYTSINIANPFASNGIPFAITSGDSIVLTNPANQSQTQTITAAANMSVGGSGSLAVNSFVANANYAIGAWIYDTKWVACTPQHFATMMAYLVAQPGLQGLDWELFNEPDGTLWGVTPTLLTQAYKLAYPAMKAADPTCTIHGLVIENAANNAEGQGILYYQSCVTAGIVGYYDALSVHIYTPNNAYNANIAPSATNAYGINFWQGVANLRAAMIAASDTVPVWITECGWVVGTDTNAHGQAQWYQDMLNMLNGYDPINQVMFSSYLKAIIQYAMDGSWGIIGQPAVGVLTQMVAGT